MVIFTFVFVVIIVEVDPVSVSCNDATTAGDDDGANVAGDEKMNI